LEALIAGQRALAVLADLATRPLRSKIPTATEALTGGSASTTPSSPRLLLDLID